MPARAYSAMATLIVYSHLRWNFVYQRPQHLLSRMARRCEVLFVEEPVHDAGEPWLERLTPCPNVEVLRPHTPLHDAGYAAAQLPLLEALVAARLAEGCARPLYAWAYTPMALPLVEAAQPDKVIYDCMDALAHFRYAPPELAEREAALLKRADVVFCGGMSLYRVRAGQHRNIHCFPSSVDAAHFAGSAGAASGADPHGPLARPRIGYCGVIDERIDLALLGAAARARPDWQFVLVGPVAKIDPAELPRLPNVHHYGQQPYADLPRYMAGWDVAIMPFALNEATRFISPTKTLEYFAAGLPVVSTAVADVVEPYAGVVEIAADDGAFVAACERLLQEPATARAARRAAMQRCIAATSWDKTAGEMWALIEAVPPRAASAGAPASVEQLTPRRSGTPACASDQADRAGTPVYAKRA